MSHKQVKSTRINFLKYWAPFYAYAALIFYLSSLPKVLPDTGIPCFDKFLHLIEYFVFGLLAARAFKSSKKSALRGNVFILAVLISISYGALDELHQLFIPGREYSLLDMTFDAIGGIGGSFIYGRYCTF